MCEDSENCWEYKDCGKGPDSKEICLAARTSKYDGKNSGKFAGRTCWIITDNLCNPEIKDKERKIIKCLECDFFKLVSKEEGRYFLFK